MRKKMLLSAGLALLMLLCACRTQPDTQDTILALTPSPAAEAATPAPTVTPVPTALPTLPPLPKRLGLLGHKYEELFTEEEVFTDTVFSSPNAYCRWYEVRDTETFSKPVTYFVVDIYVQDVTLLKTAFSNGSLSVSYKSLQKISKSVNAVVAISGDYAGARSSGLVIRNGEVLRTKLDNSRDVGVLYADGTFACYEAKNVPLEEILSNNPWQSWCFGPSLLTAEGETKTRFNSNVKGKNPRAVFGYYEPGHYCFIQVDGRQGSYSRGLSMSELSKLVYALGCKAAINLDGGATARLCWNHQLINRPSKDRPLHDILYLGHYEGEE